MNEKPTKEASKTDWQRIKSMRDEDIDYSDNPPMPEDFLEKAILWPGSGNKQQITLRLDPDVLGYFKGQGKGYQTAINDVLRRYVEAQKKPATR